MPEPAIFANKQQLVRLAINRTAPEEFPVCKLGKGITGQLVLVTPTLAREWLEKNGHIQRHQRKNHIKMIAWDIKAGRWKLTGETIIFDSNGDLCNGQHRLLAIIEADVAVTALVIRGVDPEAFAAMDTCSPRSRGDAIASMGIENGHVLGCAAQLVAQYENEESLHSAKTSKLSPVACTELLGRHPELTLAVSRGSTVYHLCHSKGIPAFCYYIFTRIDQADADAFFDRLASGEGLDKGSPILALRQRFEKTRFGQHDMIFLIFKAWNYYRRKEKCALLRIYDNEPFPELI